MPHGAPHTRHGWARIAFALLAGMALTIDWGVPAHAGGPPAPPAPQPPAAPRPDGRDASVADDRPAFSLRGVVPGQTTRAQLLKNPRWGQPLETTRGTDGEVLRYRLRGYPDARVLVRDGRVRTVDVTLAEGVREDVAARAFGLGERAAMPLPSAARDAAIEASKPWSPRPYSAGRVVLFVETVDGQSLARMLRVHAAGPAAAGETFVALQTGDTDIRIEGQSADTRAVVKYVVEFLDRYDFAGRKLNAEIAGEWMDQYLLTLDAGKNYFLRDDVERFRAMVPAIEERARKGDVTFAYDVFETYLERREKTLELVAEFLDAEHDFTVDETLKLVRPETPWPENEIELREIWRKRVKNVILQRRLQGHSDEEAVSRARRHYAQVLQIPRQIDDHTLLEWTLTALGRARGGTARYYSPKSLEDNRIQLRNQLVGIGAALKIVDGEVVVTNIVPGSPSARDGRLEKGDVIVSVTPQPGEASVPLTGLRLRDVVDHIRGAEGTTVRLDVRPQGRDETMVIRLQRAAFPLVQIRSRTFPSPAGDGTIGWIAVASFYFNARTGRSSVQDMAKILGDFREQGVDAVVLDLRNCSGGPVREAADVYGLFGDGVVMQSKDLNGEVRVYRPQARVRPAWHGPLVALVSKRTGSGAAIPAGDIRQHERGVVVGDSRTVDDAQIQNVLEIGPRIFKANPKPLGALRYTTMLLYQPDGRSPHGVGVRSHITLPSFREHSGGSTIAPKLTPDRLEAAEFEPLGIATDQVVDALRTASEARRKASPRFQEYVRQVQEYRRRVERKSIPLNEAVRRTEAAIDLQSELPDFTREDFVRHGPYVDEVLAIAADHADDGWLPEYTQAWSTLRGGDAGAAVDAFDAVVAKAGDASAPLLGRAHGHAAAGNWKAAVADLKQAGGDGLVVTVASDDELKVQSKVVAAVKPGDRLVVDNHSGEWVWAHLAQDRSQDGWIKAESIRLTLDSQQTASP